MRGITASAHWVQTLEPSVEAEQRLETPRRILAADDSPPRGMLLLLLLLLRLTILALL
jgi:hypothetical protein